MLVVYESNVNRNLSQANCSEVRETQFVSPSNEVTRQANVQFHSGVCSGPLPRRLVTNIDTATETSTDKPTMAIMAIFSVGVVLTATVLMATAGNNP